jgi:hypothetical protein
MTLSESKALNPGDRIVHRGEPPIGGKVISNQRRNAEPKPKSNASAQPVLMCALYRAHRMVVIAQPPITHCEQGKSERRIRCGYEFRADRPWRHCRCV